MGNLKYNNRKIFSNNKKFQRTVNFEGFLKRRDVSREQFLGTIFSISLTVKLWKQLYRIVFLIFLLFFFPSSQEYLIAKLFPKVDKMAFALNRWNFTFFQINLRYFEHALNDGRTAAKKLAFDHFIKPRNSCNKSAVWHLCVYEY